VGPVHGLHGTCVEREPYVELHIRLIIWSAVLCGVSGDGEGLVLWD